MTARLARNASGQRHLRWGRAIHATMRAHLDIDDLLGDLQRDALTAEAQSLDALLGKLDAAVAPYRAFVDHALGDVRARQRVANYLCDVAQQRADGAMRPHRAQIGKLLQGGFTAIFSGLPLSRVLTVGHARTAQLALDAGAALHVVAVAVPEAGPLAERLDKVGALLNGLIKEQNDTIAPQRRPLKLAVERAVLELREGLEKMDARLRQHFPELFIESLYPELARKGTAVAEEDEEEEDDGGAPDTEPTPKKPDGG